ncbi:MAG: hypothetical protein ABIX28_12765 [Vicinamibacterales bacterium]
MAKPIPPVVHGPVVEKARVVQVSSVLANATVTIFAGGAPAGTAVAAANGSVWVTVTGVIVEGQTLVATQQTPEGTSDPSPDGVLVVHLPKPLPSPVFASPMSTCMSQIRMGGLAPGAELTILVDGDPTKVVVQTKSLRTDDYFDVAPAVALPVGGTLTAVQVAGGTPPSPTVNSLTIERVVPPEGPLPAPGIAQPLSCGMTSMQLSGMVPAATFTFTNEGNAAAGLNVGSAFSAWGAPPLRVGKLEAKQVMPRCQRDGTPVTLPVAPAPPPGPPVFVSDICPDVGKVSLTNLVPGARLTLLIRTFAPASPASYSESAFLDAGVSGTDEDFNFDAAALAPPPDQVAVLTARMTMCDTGGPLAVPVKLVTAATAATLTLGAPLFDCARFVLVKGAQVGALLRVFLPDGVTPLGDPKVAANPTVRLGVWFPLHAGMKVIVTQVGCGANATLGPERVNDLPTPLPVPAIVGPVRPGAVLIDIVDGIPGAMVHLFVNNAWRTSLEVPAKKMQIPAGLPPLADHDTLWTVQTLCDRKSNVEGHQTVVTLGTMSVAVSPSPVTRGVTTAVTVSAKDVETGAAIVGGTVAVGGSVAGTTAVAFNLLAKPGFPTPIAGVVRQPPAYADAPFGIPLIDPPPPPPPTGKLTLNIGNPTIAIGALTITSATWTIQPAWGAPAITAAGITATVSIPTPPAGTATPNQRVDVTLACQATANGYINGYAFSGLLTCQNGAPSPVGIAWSGSNLAAGWLALLEMPVADTGQPFIVVTMKWISTVPA